MDDRIQVLTPDLHNGSQTLNSSAGTIGGVQSQVSNIPAIAGNAYDGQLRQVLEGIIGAEAQTGSRLQNRALDLGEELTTRALGFEAANEAGRSAMLRVSSQDDDSVESSPTLGFLSYLNFWKEKALSIWNSAGLLFGGLASLIFVNTKTNGASRIFTSDQPTSTIDDQIRKVVPETRDKKPQSINLNDSAKPTIKGSCAIYAQQRRPDLGKTSDPKGATNDQGAYNYKYKEGTFQLSSSETNDLRELIAPGYALVWDKTTPGANATYGHVAIIEEVYSDHVVVSHSGWSEGTQSEFSRDYIVSRQLYLVP